MRTAHTCEFTIECSTPALALAQPPLSAAMHHRDIRLMPLEAQMPVKHGQSSSAAPCGIRAAAAGRLCLLMRLSSSHSSMSRDLNGIRGGCSGPGLLHEERQHVTSRRVRAG